MEMPTKRKAVSQSATMKARKIAEKKRKEETSTVYVPEIPSYPKRSQNDIELQTYPQTSQNCIHECVRPINWTEEPEFMGTPARTFPYDLDTFQSTAIKCLEKKESVLVSAHTSAGKTTVAEYAIAMALRDKQRIIYTSPIKALSNQKYRDFTRPDSGFSDVGLMTGDVTIAPNASIMIMTTEILRSMLYRGSELCREMAWVVFDEVHYMMDRERGVVWEETMILCPDTVKMVFLSATIPNSREFAEWICRIKHQPCHCIYTNMRPTPLQHFLFPVGSEGVYMVVDDSGKFLEDNFTKAVSVLQSQTEQQQTELKARNRKKGDSLIKEDMSKLVRMCQDRSYLPVIVFSFAKKDCEVLALAMKRMDLTDEVEKAAIENVYKSATSTLADEDQDLPHVQNMVGLLKRGVGIHHGGLLPILKEIVEILFSEGLIKVLFTTETFAMGVNMPAKTVIFKTVRKFDGIESRWLRSGEYIQMSGRAGRRGKDDKGITIIMLEEDVDPELAKNMLCGQATRMTSSFRLSYHMLLNLLRVEGADPEYMMQRSFRQFQEAKVTLSIDEERKQIEIEVQKEERRKENKEKFDWEKTEEELGFDPDQAIASYYEIHLQYKRHREKLREEVMQPHLISTFLNPRRLVQVGHEGVWGWGIACSAVQRKTMLKPKDVSRIHVKEAEEKDEEVEYVVEVFLKCSPEDPKNPSTENFQLSDGTRYRPYQENLKQLGRVFPVSLSVINNISTIKSIGDTTNISNNEERQNEMLAMLNKILKHKMFLDSGIPLLDPVKDVKITSEAYFLEEKKAAECEERLRQNPLYLHESLEPYFKTFEKTLHMQQRHEELSRKMEIHQHVIMKDELRQMKRVLKRLGFIDNSGVVQLKGRLACEISTAQELVITEIICQNIFEELQSEHIVALLSCFVFDDSSDENTPIISDVQAAFDECQKIVRHVGTVMVDCKINIDLEQFCSKTMKPHIMDICLMWLDGHDFKDIMEKYSMFYEGTIVRALRRLEELIRELVTAATTIGNEKLAEKLKLGRQKLKRGIIFAASLYL